MGCIPFEELSRDNLPPFYVRLQDDQVGHLVFWVSASRGSIARLKLGQVWPWDFDVQGRISSRRDSWGAEYGGSGKERGKGLPGGKKVPAWTDPGLPLTYTSSHKVMAGELDALKKGAAQKRKADEEAGRNACMPIKKLRLGSIGVELKKMKESVEKKRQKDKTAEMEKARYAGAKPELRDAVQVVDTLMRSATETENQNAVLEAMLLKSEADYIKDTSDMFDEWLAYNEIKRKEVERIHEDHANEIKNRDTKIDALEKEMKGSRARLNKEKRKVKLRNERLAQVKSRWLQEQILMEKKLREVEETAFDLEEMSELNYDTDESEDEESGFEVEPEEAKEEAKKVKEAKNMKDGKDTEEVMKGPINKELKRSVERETVKSMYAQEFVNLDEDEDEDEDDEVPLSSRRKAMLRSFTRTK